MLSFLEAPKGFIKKADLHRKRMVWDEIDSKKRYHLVNWHTICLPKDCGGLGVLDLPTMNKSLLCKWLWKLENTEEIWQQMLTKKNTRVIRFLLKLVQNQVVLIFGKV
jgi:hypothetical protein